jgi:hypothetical protein
LLFGLQHVRKVTQDHVAVKKIFRCVAFYFVAAGVAPGVEWAVTPGGKSDAFLRATDSSLLRSSGRQDAQCLARIWFSSEGIFDSSPMLQLWGLDAERP